ncbi:MAG: hypothetical protein JXX29_18400 [Deltaproteobacteria bacterium]|nr:hypothetical protein [Deltaproteobacteria bacterium]MBN2673657.1 hypothetical protein [Deltaproteobacteria bacterium]
MKNGRYSECGTIVSTAPLSDLVYNNAPNSLLFRTYEAGRVKAKILLAEFCDGQAASAVKYETNYCGYGEPLRLENKKLRSQAISEAEKRIERHLSGIIADNESDNARSIREDCKAILRKLRQASFW